MEQQKRLSWIDISKGFGMICVVMGHSYLINGSAYYLRALIYGFHMPLFFILSGYLMGGSINRGGLIKKRVYSLLIPYVSYSIITQTFEFAFAFVRGNPHSILNDVIGFVIQIRGSDYPGAVWFLTWMFVTQIIMLGVLKLAKTEACRNILCVVIFGIGVVFICVLKRKLPWHIDAACIQVLFLRFGMIYKDKQDVTDKYLSKFIGVTAVLYVAVISLNTVVFSKRYVDIYDGVLGNPLLYVLSALLGSAVVIYISQKVNADNAFFRYISSIGRHSLTVYGLHNIFLVILYSVFAKIGLKSGSGPIEIIRAVIFTAICMIIIVPIGKLLEKLFPILFGYKKRKS